MISPDMPDKITKLVEKAFPDAQSRLVDTTGGGDHFELLVITKAFEGKGLLDRHRMVYGALGSIVGNEVHALALKTLTPDEAGRK